ncbi:MAG: DUF1565 domain-containing protein [Desmonostoc vinosum HA7617-LM4]|jgi:parallel beta-helix repeat protein|nr:DUF1565 domain-containing protein [Desmonostoc vinosum HA7617-LM4]
MFIESVMLSVAGCSVLNFTVGTGMMGVAFLGLSFGSAIAQMPSTPEMTTPIGENTLFVNPSVGDDNTGNGSDRTPFKTITQALRIANVNTVIILSPGTYSAETGETFPLMMKQGVSIQGNPENKGKDITIQGGGNYLSRSFGGQNVTIVGANQASLTGVTVSNSNPRGYGLWIESSNPAIAENTFTGSTQDGISVTGNAAPTISKNYFYRNGANGLTIAGNSRPQVRENIFEQTGYGINIAQNAAPLVVGNQIQQNRAGVLVQANARPILRNNLIQGSKEDGLVAIAQAMPDLGNASEPGGNQFQNNARYDINTSTAKQIISAAGNNLVSSRIQGKVDLSGTTALEPQNPPVSSRIQEVPSSGEISFAAPGVADTANNRPIPPNNSTNPQLNSQLLPLLPAKLPVAIPRSNQQPPKPRTSKVTGFPIPTSLPNGQVPTDNQVVPETNTTPKPETPQVNYVQIDPNTIEFTAPGPSSNSTAQISGKPLPVLEAASPGDLGLLPLPDGNTRNLPNLPLPQTSPTGSIGGESLPPARATQPSIRYRVVVQFATDKDRDLVRSLAPGAFPTVWQGQKVMQVGVFTSEYNAKEMVKILDSKGLRAVMEPLN